MTQILDLLLLAPDIQERLLEIEAVDDVEPLDPGEEAARSREGKGSKRELAAR